jgi:imidazolonepropionase-like amidohydrolase
MVIERGLSEDAALAAVTRDAAEILGIANQLGRIAPGNLAHLTIMTKPLAEEEAQTKFVFIDGKKFEIDREETDEEKKSEGREEDASAATEKGKDAAPAEETTKPEPKPDESPVFAAEIEQERIPKTKTGGNVLIRNATLIPVSSPAVTDASLLIRNGRIAQMGPAIEAPEGVTVIDATGRFVIPGFVDCHSHLALDSVNESPLAISAEVRIADMIVPDHVGLFRALAGGTTTHHVMHGSANPIGGQNATLKLKYRRPVREMVIEGAPRTIKFALGENVTQANFPENWGKRYPNTRMGVETTMRLAFDEARQYQQEWDEYARRSKAGEDVPPPRQDLRLEALADVLGGRMTVHCHCYRSEEILRLFDVAETYGIRIGTLHHVLEGYRIAPEIARHGAGASTFSNFWAYKVEAFGAIPHNAAMMTRFGVNSSLNSDSADTIRYFGLEAAKTVRWGDLDETEALKLVTLNPAMQLGIEDRVGSLEVGKDGDVAIFNGHPLNSFSKCVMTLIEGEVYFEDARPEPIEEVDAGTGWPKAFPPFRGVLDRTIPEDRIHAVGKDVDIPPGAGVINAAGLHVYPGLVDAGSTLGLDEIGSLRATRDHGEIATFNPQVVAGSAVHPHSEHLRITRAVGVTTTLARPTGARIAGQSSLVHLDGWTAPEMVIAGRFGLHVTVPSLPVDLAGTDEFVPLELAACPRSDCMIIDELGEPPFFRRRRGAALDDEAKKKQRDEHKKAVRELEDFLAKAKHYAKVQALAESDAQIPFERDLALEAMMPYVKGEKPVVLSANQFKEILDAMEFAEKHQLRWILAGGSESWKLAAALAEKNIPVILGPPTMQPRGDFEPWDSVYRCAGELDRAGVRFCFASGSAADAYNLPIEMGLAVAHGLPRVKAEYALTRGAAEILGVAGERGSIEVGKMADLIVTTSSPVQAVNQVTHMFIDGRPIDLSNMHEENYEKFMSRPNPHLPPPKDLRGPKNLTNAARWRDAVGWRGRKEGVDDNSWHPSPTKSAERAAAEDDRPAEGRQAPGP